jgi:hypothetical protein
VTVTVTVSSRRSQYFHVDLKTDLGYH